MPQYSSHGKVGIIPHCLHLDQSIQKKVAKNDILRTLSLGHRKSHNFCLGISLETVTLGMLYSEPAHHCERPKHGNATCGCSRYSPSQQPASTASHMDVTPWISNKVKPSNNYSPATSSGNCTRAQSAQISLGAPQKHKK